MTEHTRHGHDRPERNMLAQRRDFLKTAALAGGGLALGGSGLFFGGKQIINPTTKVLAQAQGLQATLQPVIDWAQQTYLPARPNGDTGVLQQLIGYYNTRITRDLSDPMANEYQTYYWGQPSVGDWNFTTVNLCSDPSMPTLDFEHPLALAVGRSIFPGYASLRNPNGDEINMVLNRLTQLGANTSFSQVANALLLPDVVYTDPIYEQLYGRESLLIQISQFVMPDGTPDDSRASLFYAVDSMIAVPGQWPITCRVLAREIGYMKVAAVVLLLASVICGLVPPLQPLSIPLLELAGIFVMFTEILIWLYDHLCGGQGYNP